MAEAKKGRKTALVLLLVLMAAGAAAGGTYYVAGRGDAPKEKKKAKPSIGPILSLDPFVVNIQDAEGNRFLLRVTIDLELAESKSKHEEEVKKFVPRLRDSILTLLSAVPVDDALKPEMKALVKSKILELANGVLGRGSTRAVYFKEFVVP